jgi:NADH-quinone oxidoreductase subunit J
MMAGLFILLKAFLVATILVLVYAGAILVLFLFVVMLVDVKKIENYPVGASGRARLRSLIAVTLAAVFLYQTFHVINSIPSNSVSHVQGTTEAIGRLLFTNYLLPFELTSFLLLAAVVSVVVLAKKVEKN